MKKQIRRVFALFGLLVVMTSSVATSAQNTRVVVISIPFDFVVANERMPSGDYTISRVSRDQEQILLVRSVDKNVATIIKTSTVERRVAPGKAQVTFTRYEDQYFLAQIWTPASTEGREAFKSRLEKSLERELTERRKVSSETAEKKSGEATTVTITATVR